MINNKVKLNYHLFYVILFKDVMYSVIVEISILFSYVDVGGTSTTSVVLDEVLEEAPKWKVLRVSE